MKKPIPHRLRETAPPKPAAANAQRDAQPAGAVAVRRERPAKWKCPRCGTRKLLRGHRRGGDQPG